MSKCMNREQLQLEKHRLIRVQLEFMKLFPKIPVVSFHEEFEKIEDRMLFKLAHIPQIKRIINNKMNE